MYIMSMVLWFPLVEAIFIQIFAGGISKAHGSDDPSDVNRVIGIGFPCLALFGISFTVGVFVSTVTKDREDKIRYLLHFAG